jgi:hypothetical protein
MRGAREVSGAVVLLACGAAHADGARIGLEYESEKDNKTGVMNGAVTVKPGWEFSEDSLINLVELLIERNQDAEPDSNGVRARETKLFVRLRYNRNFSEHIGYYIRGGVGRSFNNQQDFNYAYIEPGLKYKFNQKWEWILGVREIDSIDGIDGQHVQKVITGPSYSFDKNNELELRYIRAYGDKDLESWQLGYTHRF